MDFLFDYVIPFLFVLTVLVFVHELGHYWVARRNGVRVEVFSIGFGRELFGWTDKAGTRWKVSAVPLGGYVRMFGEGDLMDENDNQREMTPDEKAESFQHKRLGQRAAVVVAGPLANFLFAILVFALLFGIAGQPNPLPAVGQVQDDSAAAEAGLQAGDLIVAVDGQETRRFEDLRDIVSQAPGERLSLTVVRDGQTITLEATPRRHEAAGGETIGLLGVRPDPEKFEYESVGPVDAAWMAVERSFVITGTILSGLGEIITGSRTTEDLGGPLRIAQLSGEVAQGGLVNLFSFIAAFSINLCLINLFPIPMLDGGHLVFYAIEAVRGRPLGARAQEYGFRVGLFLVLALMVFATWNDLVQLEVIEFIKDLVT